MKIKQPNNWPTTVEEAIAIQNQLQAEVITEDQLPEVRYVAGVDLGFEEDYAISRAAVVVLSFPDLQLVEQAIARRPTTFPYIPGFLSFREVPAIMDALEKVSTTPDLLNALQSLSRRCLIEQQGSFYELLPVVKQYVKEL